MPVTPPAAARPSGSLLQPFPNPAVPLRSSASAALNDFLAHHTEDIASALELCAAQAVHKVTKDNLEAAQAAHLAAEARVAEANRASAPLGCSRNPSQYGCQFSPIWP